LMLMLILILLGGRVFNKSENKSKSKAADKSVRPTQVGAYI
jgi:hypothetical protein